MRDIANFRPPQPDINPIIATDIDRLMRTINDGIPMLDSETIYFSELDSQIKIFSVVMILGALIFVFGVFI